MGRVIPAENLASLRSLLDDKAEFQSFPKKNPMIDAKRIRTFSHHAISHLPISVRHPVHLYHRSTTIRMSIRVSIRLTHKLRIPVANRLPLRTPVLPPLRLQKLLNQAPVIARPIRREHLRHKVAFAIRLDAQVAGECIDILPSDQHARIPRANEENSLTAR